MAKEKRSCGWVRSDLCRCSWFCCCSGFYRFQPPQEMKIFLAIAIVLMDHGESWLIWTPSSGVWSSELPPPSGHWCWLVGVDVAHLTLCGFSIMHVMWCQLGDELLLVPVNLAKKWFRLPGRDELIVWVGQVLLPLWSVTDVIPWRISQELNWPG